MRAKKHLGQHFLQNKKILEEICRAAELSKSDIVVEVGPGRGELTEFLAVGAGKVIAVEKDRELIPFLEEKFRSYKNVKIIQGDILKLTPYILKLKPGYKIVANLPYYITSRFLRTFLERKQRPKLMVLMVQYEVAKRICARPPEMNLLALSVQAYGLPKFIRKVSRGNFSPPPKVDSGVIKISDISDGWFRRNKIKPKKFFGLARRAFQQKRKMLRHSLKNLDFPKNYLTKRPEELSLEEWINVIE
ncbi:MAG: 16S rRNA (adenine(1518)-N(6)/adenine(1519)-N(6))-dimethyltransferase RsmA [bacterium]|nr:16S rRNA (adenine(1518)-N(6)/adenine(1519)-N(6))-dimethyltransferase RsmA [bacterium]